MLIIVKDSMNKLSKRLEMVARLVPNGTKCADIGADHGYLIIDLFKSRQIQSGYACENKVGPYNNLKKNIEINNLQEYIYADLSDGIRTLPSDIDTVIIAGMGGDTVCKIIEDSIDKLDQIDNFIISSHTKMDEVRKFLMNHNYHIIEEDACFDMNQYYEATLFRKGKKVYSYIELKYGPYLLEDKNQNTLKFLEEKYFFNQKLMENDKIPQTRIDDLKTENLELQSIIKLFN